MRSIGNNILRLLIARNVRGLLLAGFSLAATLLFGPVSHQAAAQATHSIKIVVPLPPGGAGDIVARLLAEQVGRAHGVAIVTENRPGAGTIIGTESVARAAPDGGTLLINAPYILINPHLRKVNFDPLSSFDPLCYLVSSPGVIVVNSTSPYRTRVDRWRASEAGRSDAGECRTGYCAVHRIRDAPARRQHQYGLCSVCRRRTRN